MTIDPRQAERLAFLGALALLLLFYLLIHS
ncbi:membrane protein [Microbacterium phage IAmGroot]|uniref:Membrane protein n=1 Tax=Microbacterium phage IAmGroot TaxID=2588486 RepID=A0A4Y6E745_9CAUD|nr:membrane protein [Microbacterium phage IAmGroot]